MSSLAKGLRVFIYPDVASGGLRDALTGQTVALGAGKEFRTDPQYGTYIYNDGTAGTMPFDYTVLNNDWGDVVSIASIFSWDTHLGDGRDIVACGGGGDDFLLNFGTAANENGAFRIGNGVNNTNISLAEFDDWTAWHVLAGWRNSGEGQIIMNEEAISPVQTTVTLSPNAMAHNLTVFPTTTDVGSFVCFAIWNRKITHFEAKSFYANPYQVFKSQRIHTLRDIRTPDIAVIDAPASGMPPRPR